jgi:hypothetical protein
MIFGASLNLTNGITTCAICNYATDICQSVDNLNFQDPTNAAFGLEIIYPQVYVLYGQQDYPYTATFLVYDMSTETFIYNVTGSYTSCGDYQTPFLLTAGK